MYARIVTNFVQPNKVEEGIQLYRESVLPETKQQRGFQGAMALADHSKSKVLVITLWQSEEDAQASGASSAYLQAQFAKAASLYTAAPLVETYEVIVQDI